MPGALSIFRFLRTRIEDIDTDFCRVALLHRLELTNPRGDLHRGTIVHLQGGTSCQSN